MADKQETNNKQNEGSPSKYSEEQSIKSDSDEEVSLV